MELRDEIFKSETEFLIQESLQSGNENLKKKSFNIKKDKPVEVSIEDFQMNYLNNEIILATYTTVKKHKNRIFELTFRRSIWEYKDNKWVNSLHKGIKTT